MSKLKILIVDDDKKLNELLSELLKDFGFDPCAASRPEEAFRMMKDNPPDLIILDIMLPEMNGFEVCKKIRQSSSVPIIMLTARGEVTDKVVGLELGADDYLPKPFEPRELIARIQTIFRRTTGPEKKGMKQFGPLKIDFDRHGVELSGKKVDLTTIEFEALSLLVKNRGKILNRDQILEALRGMECDAFNRSVDITISRLRHKLRDDPKKPSFIKTVFGSGYLFIGAENRDEV
jgi:DNA-binding response OmpR family regulator